jgi:hypothetical protein
MKRPALALDELLVAADSLQKQKLSMVITLSQCPPKSRQKKPRPRRFAAMWPFL